MEPRDTSDVRWGMFVSAATIFPRSDFNNLPGIPRINNIGTEPYNGGTGVSFSAGAEVNLNIADSWTWLAAAAYSYTDGQLDAIESFTYATATGRADGQFNYSLPYTFQHLELYSGLRFYPFRGGDSFMKNLNISGAINAAFLLSSDVQQQIALAVPEDADLVSGPPADSPPTQLENPAGITAGIRSAVLYDLELNNTFLFSPGIEAVYAFSSVETTVDWAQTALSLTFQLSWRNSELWPLELEKQFKRDTLIDVVPTVNTEDVILNNSRVDTSYRVDTDARLRIQRLTITESYIRRIPAANPILSASIESRFVLADGTEASFADLGVQMVDHVQMRKLLPIMACEPKQSLRAFEPAEQFEQSLVYCSPQQSLDSIAQRLGKLATGQNVSLIVNSTCPDNEEATRRTELRDRLIRRLALPSTADIKFANTTALGTNWHPLPIEFSYVDIGSQSATLMAPALFRKVRPYVAAPHIRFAINAVSEAGIKTWQLLITQRGRMLRLFKGSGLPPTTIDWDASNQQETWFGFEDDLEFVLTLVDEQGRRYDSAPGLIQIGSEAIGGPARDLAPVKKLVRFPLEWLAARDGNWPNLQNLLNTPGPGATLETVNVYTYRHHHRVPAEYAQFLDLLSRGLGVAPSDIRNTVLADTAADVDMPSLLENLERGFAIVEVWFAL